MKTIKVYESQKTDNPNLNLETGLIVIETEGGTQIVIERDGDIYFNKPDLGYCTECKQFKLIRKYDVNDDIRRVDINYKNTNTRVLCVGDHDPEFDDIITKIEVS